MLQLAMGKRCFTMDEYFAEREEEHKTASAE